LKPQINSVYSGSKSPLVRSRGSDDLNEPSLSDKGAIIPEALSSKGIAMQEEQDEQEGQGNTEAEKPPVVVISGTEPIQPEEKAAMKTEEPPVQVKVIEPEKQEETVVKVKKEEDVPEVVDRMLNSSSSASSSSTLPSTSETVASTEVSSQPTTAIPLSSSTINDFKEEIKTQKEEITELENLINSNEEQQQQPAEQQEQPPEETSIAPRPESLSHSTSRSVLEDIKSQLTKLDSQMEEENITQLEEESVKQQLQNVKEEIVVVERVINDEMISKVSADVTHLADIIEKEQNQNLLETLRKSNSLKEELEDRNSDKNTGNNVMSASEEHDHKQEETVTQEEGKVENDGSDDKMMKKLPSLMSVGSKDAGDEDGDGGEIPATKESEQKFKIRLSDVADSDDDSDA
jgi:hypothetical protein